MHRTQNKNPSKVCQARYEEYRDKVHADKLANIKPSIDNTPPKAQVHLENRRKRDQQKEERLSVIEEHNHILLKKMMTIMKTPSKSIPPANSSPPTRPKTLNTETRKKQLEEINAQNQALLKRLQGAKAYYDHKDWDDFGATQEKYLNNICEYPVVKNAKPKPKTAPLGTPTTSSSPQQKAAIRRTVSGPSSTAKPKTTSSPAAKGTGAKKVTKKPAGEKPKKRSNDSDDDSLQLSDPESDIGDLAAGTSNLDINKGDFSKLDDDDEKTKEDNDDLDLGSEFSDDSLDLDDDDGDNDGTEAHTSVTKSKTAKSSKSKKTSTISSVGPKDDERTEYTEQDKATIESSEKHEEFEQDTEAYKPKDDDDEDEDEGETTADTEA